MRIGAALGAMVLLASACFAACGGNEFSADESADAGTGGTTGCAPGQKRCGGQCVSRNEPSVGCGADTCAPCFIPQATAYQCLGSGECIATACEAGFDQCDSTPDCENIQTFEDCGSCGKACAPGQVCDSGSCTSECSGGKQNCSGTCADTQTDISNCGECGTVCAADNAQVSCSGGECQFSCNPEFEDCNQQAPDGCEVHLLSDPEHCGDCQTVCEGQLGACDQGTCACAEPLITCPPAPMCIDGKTDPQHCGGCSACPATQFCKGGSCTTPNCAFGLAQCTSKCVNLQSDPSHCGSCGNACSAIQSCVDGVCQNTCVGTEICNVLCTSFDWDATNCGGCDVKCGPGTACIEGSCIDAVVASHASDCPAQACAIPASWNAPNGVNFLCLGAEQTCPP
jgi:hypothetical protein